MSNRNRDEHNGNENRWYEYIRNREREENTRLIWLHILSIPVMFFGLIVFFTWIDNVGRPHRWAAFFHRLGIDYWASPTLQWIFY